MRRWTALLIILSAVVAVLVAPRPAAAQTTTTPLARFITDLIAAGAIVDAGGLNIDKTHATERTDFLSTTLLAGMPAILNQSVGLQIMIFPVDLGLDASGPGSDSVPAHAAYAPSFAVHAGAVGRGKLSMSLNYDNGGFRSLDGIGLDSGQMGFVFTSPRDAATVRDFGRNVLTESVMLRLHRDVMSFGLVYGAADGLDIGIGVPFVRINMEGQVRSQLFHFGGNTASRLFFDAFPATPLPSGGCFTSSIDIPSVNRTGLGTATNPLEAPADMVELNSRVVTRNCTASGVGDIVAHARYRFKPFGANAIAVSVDARFPTGDKDNLLGTGATRTTAAFIWSAQTGRFGPHATVGYTLSNGNSSALFNTVGPGVQSPQPLDLKVPNEIDVAAGTDIVFFRRLTTSVNVFARRIDNVQKFRADQITGTVTAPDPAVPGTLLQTNGTGGLMLAGVASAQVALTDRTLLKGNLLFPLMGDGLAPRLGFGAGLGFRF